MLLSEDGDVLSKAYLLSKGNPIQDTIDIFDELRETVESAGASLEISGVGTTCRPHRKAADSLAADERRGLDAEPCRRRHLHCCGERDAWHKEVVVKRFAVCLSALFLASLALVAARPDRDIRVTAGSLTFEGAAGQIAIRGTSDFRMSATVDIAGGIFFPQGQCEGLDCPPGTQVNLEAFWSGQDLRGKLRLHGTHYVLGSESEGGALGEAGFEGTLTLPDFNDSDTVAVCAPFSFSGDIDVSPQGGGAPATLSGGGIATVEFARSPDGPAWVFVRATYAFERHTRRGRRSDCAESPIRSAEWRALRSFGA